MSKAKIPIVFLFIIISIALIIAIDANEDTQRLANVVEDNWTANEVDHMLEYGTRFNYLENTEFLHFLKDNWVTQRQLGEALEDLK